MNILATLTHFKSIQAQLKELEEALKIDREKITGYMDEKGTDRIVCGQYIATRKECNRKSLDEKLIRANYPEVAAEAEKVTTYERLTVQ